MLADNADGPPVSRVRVTDKGEKQRVLKIKGEKEVIL